MTGAPSMMIIQREIKKVSAAMINLLTRLFMAMNFDRTALVLILFRLIQAQSSTILTDMRVGQV